MDLHIILYIVNISRFFPQCPVFKTFFIFCFLQAYDGLFAEEIPLTADTCFSHMDILLSKYYKKDVCNMIILEIITVANLNNPVYNFQYIFYGLNLPGGLRLLRKWER